ncbi:MAG: CPBP family intramembrane metalloprotease [Deltaproteobacteria bacterium]|nr:CPBP family intramembrane metalloprotease [Deltaproteobacteria bacterium]
MENTETKQLSTWQWVVLNSLPILLAIIQRAAIPPILERWGLPPRYIDFVALGALFELGFILYLGKKLTGRLTFKKAVLYREPIPWWWYPLGFVIFFLLAFGIMTLLTPVGNFLRETIFAGMATSTTPIDASLYSRTVLVVMAVGILIIKPLAAVAEELYFRGTLLPRMEHLGMWAPVLSAFFWAGTHIGQLGDIPGLALGFLPMIIFTMRKKNVYMITLIHGLSNVVTAIAIVAQVFGGAS